MIDQPRVSVLLPVFNAEPWLEVCRKSLNHQTLRDFEVIAVDDGSRDASGHRLEQWAKDDHRIRLVRQTHAGLVAALNRGLEQCRAPLVARFDADDAAHPQRLERQVEALDRRPEIDVVSCRVRHFPRQHVGRGFALYEEWLNSLLSHDEIARERFVESPIAHPSVVIRRSVLVAAGGWREGPFPEDYDLWLRLIENGTKFLKLPEVLHLWREHPDRATRVDQRYAVDRFRRLKAQFLATGPLKGAGTRSSFILWGAGQTGRALAKHLIANGASPYAFVDIDPKKIGRTVRGRPVYDAEELERIMVKIHRPIVITAVSSRGARSLIRARLSEIGLVEGQDFWCAA